jgi:hypothetical protein
MARVKKPAKKWSAAVARKSDALDIENRTFASNDPKRVARSLKRSAERSRRRKAGPYQSAMSMLNFYINRAGKTLPAAHKRVLTRAKDELRALFGREKARPRKRTSTTRRGGRGSRKRARASA